MTALREILPENRGRKRGAMRDSDFTVPGGPTVPPPPRNLPAAYFGRIRARTINNGQCAVRIAISTPERDSITYIERNLNRIRVRTGNKRAVGTFEEPARALGTESTSIESALSTPAFQYI